MSRIIETKNVVDTGNWLTMVFTTTAKVTVNRFIQLGSQAEKIHRQYYYRHKETKNQTYCDEIGQWLAKH